MGHPQPGGLNQDIAPPARLERKPDVIGLARTFRSPARHGLSAEHVDARARFGPERQALMKRELERIVATPGLSKDVFEQVSKSLA